MRIQTGAASGLVVTAGLILLGPGRANAQPGGSDSRSHPVMPSVREAAERRWGQAMFEEYLARSTPWAGVRVNEYVNRLGQNLARASNSPYVFTLRVVDSPEPNAQAFPGGFVVVNSGVITLAESEAEFVSVLAHEVAHLNARHWHRQRSRLGVFTLLTMVPLMVGTGPLAWFVFYGSAAASPLAEAKFSRSFEIEADGLAMGYLARAGYDPEATVSLLEKYRAAQVRRSKGKCGLLSTHPSSASRVKRLRKSLLRIKVPARALVTTSEFESIREEILAYDRLHAEPLGDRLPNGDPAPPRLQRRPVPPSHRTD